MLELSYLPTLVLSLWLPDIGNRLAPDYSLIYRETITMPIKQVLSHGRVPVKIWTDEIEERAQQQLSNIATLPFIHKHIAAMPDVHTGIGATIGSVIACNKAIIPAAVGVDIGCGMIACRLSLTANDLDEKLIKKVFDQINRDVPVGRDQHRQERALVAHALPFEQQLKVMTEKHPQLLKSFGKFSNWIYQMGTLGGGNHFIELCLDEMQRVWIMLHSGSRGIGNGMGNYFIELARKDMERWFISYQIVIWPISQRAASISMITLKQWIGRSVMRLPIAKLCWR